MGIAMLLKKTIVMSDNKQLRGKQDRNKVNSQEPYEVEDLHQKYPHLSHDEVREAVKKFGPDRENIEKHLSSVDGER